MKEDTNSFSLGKILFSYIFVSHIFPISYWSLLLDKINNHKNYEFSYAQVYSSASPDYDYVSTFVYDPKLGFKECDR